MLELCHEAEAKARVYGIIDQARDSARIRLEAFVGQLYDLTAYTLLIVQADGGRILVNPTEKRIGA